MKATLTNPNSAALTGFLLAMPFISLFSLLVLGIEISFGPLDPLLAAEGSRIGSLIFFGAFLLLLVGLFVSLRPVVQGWRKGNRISSNPANLLVGVTIVFFILAFAGAIIVDQYPCWTGVPNCD